MRLFVCGIALVAATSTAVTASRANQPGHLGLGGIIGEPTGASGKYVFDDRFALQGAIGISILEKGFWIGADFLLQFRSVFTHDGRWPLYIGAGVVIQDRGNSGKTNKGETSLGIRAVGGVEFHALERLSIFAEVSVQPFIIPKIDFGVGLGAGARYWL